MNTYTLRELESENYPQAPRGERDHLQLGQTVKLGFVPGVVQQIGTEWMWVIVVARTPDGYRGRLDNEPSGIPGLAYGDEVVFKAEHVLTIYTAAGQVH